MLISYSMDYNEIKNDINKNISKNTDIAQLVEMSYEILQLKKKINELKLQNKKLITENQHLVRLAGGRLL